MLADVCFTAVLLLCIDIVLICVNEEILVKSHSRLWFSAVLCAQWSRYFIVNSLNRTIPSSSFLPTG